MATTVKRPKKLHPSYERLLRIFPLVSLKTKREITEAREVLNGLLRKGRLNAGEELYLEALSDLIEVYEDAHFVIPDASDAAMLAALLDAKGVTPAEVSRATGIPKPTLSMILSGKRQFSKGIIAKFAEYFHVSVGVLASNIATPLKRKGDQ
jgi:HTH-type transcriptional regulator/antitoxin HigA